MLLSYLDDGYSGIRGVKLFRHPTVRDILTASKDAGDNRGACLDQQTKSIRLRQPGRSAPRIPENHHEYRTAPRTQRRDVPGEGVEKVQATTAGPARFVEFYPRGGPT